MHERTNTATDPNRTVTLVIYILQTTSFLVGITFLVALIINYVKLDDVRGSWLESHFRWQIRTFWYSVLWTVLGLATVVLGVGYLILFVAMVWLIYRIAKGWIYLLDGKPMNRVA